LVEDRLPRENVDAAFESKALGFGIVILPPGHPGVKPD
jgi:hypothetical protein